MPPTTSAASAPPRPASPLPTAKATEKIEPTLIPSPFGDPLVVDGSAQTRAEARADEEQLQRRGDHAADRDDEQPIAADADAVKGEAAAEPVGQVNLLRLGAEEEAGDRHRHEDEADGEQHLIERRRAIEAAVERALEHGADSGRDEEGDGQRREERAIPPGS